MPGERGAVTRISATGALRQRLLDMGFLPDAVVVVDRTGLGGDPRWGRCQGCHLALRGAEARAVGVRAAV